jgi:hypothetical protein
MLQLLQNTISWQQQSRLLISFPQPSGSESARYAIRQKTKLLDNNMRCDLRSHVVAAPNLWATCMSNAIVQLGIPTYSIRYPVTNLIMQTCALPRKRHNSWCTGPPPPPPPRPSVQE